MRHDAISLLLIGHGSRSEAGVAEYWEFFRLLEKAADGLPVGGGFIELAAPTLDEAIDDLVDRGAARVVAVPLVLLGAGHQKDDGPAALARARRRHPAVRFDYGRALGVHPSVLAAAADCIADCIAGGAPTDAVVLVGRGSTDPDANSDLYKVARLLHEMGAAPMVEPAFVSLAPPDVPAALERCRRLGATHVAVIPYFLFTGVLVDRIGTQAAAWAEAHGDVEVTVGRHVGPDPRVVDLVLERYREAVAGDAHMNCDCCIHRSPFIERR